MKFTYKLVVVIMMPTLFSCTRDLERETWIVPCGYTGTLTVYFTGKAPNKSEAKRMYKFNKRGVFYSDQDINEGFTPDFNQALTIQTICDKDKKRILFYQGADTSKAKSGEVYATYFLSGNEELDCESILIERKK